MRPVRFVIAIASGLLALAGCGGGGAGGSQCAGLDLATCRTTAGCVADLCYACTCQPSFMGCRGENDTPYACPPLGCAQPQCCGDDTTCTTPDTCLAPGQSVGCGACDSTTGDCLRDRECNVQAGEVCDPIPCSCTNEMHCVPGCMADTDCGTAEVCDTDLHRCRGKACTVDTDCPANFGCDGTGACARKACTTDTDCDGFCVDKQCYDAQGVCPPPAA